MALKPTIYKMTIAVSDLNRGYYDNLNLTIAQHPSETLERMMVRALAYCCNAQELLVFCKGLSDADEPDIWAHTLDGRLALWIDVGEPAFERIKKASRIAAQVKIYAFNSRADVWWDQGREKFSGLPGLAVYRFDWEQIKALTKMVERTMDLSVTISGDSVYVATKTGECEVLLQQLLGQVD